MEDAGLLATRATSLLRVSKFQGCPSVHKDSLHSSSAPAALQAVEDSVERRDSGHGGETSPTTALFGGVLDDCDVADSGSKETREVLTARSCHCCAFAINI